VPWGGDGITMYAILQAGKASADYIVYVLYVEHASGMGTALVMPRRLTKEGCGDSSYLSISLLVWPGFKCTDTPTITYFPSASGA